MHEYNTYVVWFSTCNYNPESVTVEAADQDCALILAKAERIKEEKDHTLRMIEMKRNYRVAN
jgi:hypothetical protein